MRNPAFTASSRNIFTVSSEYSSRSLPTNESLARTSCDDRNDVAADGVGLEDVQQFARAGPDQFEVGVRRQKLHGFRHQRHGIAPGIGDAPGKDRDVGRRPAGQGGNHAADLRHRHQRGDVQL